MGAAKIGWLYAAILLAIGACVGLIGGFMLGERSATDEEGEGFLTVAAAESITIRLEGRISRLEEADADYVTRGDWLWLENRLSDLEETDYVTPADVGLMVEGLIDEVAAEAGYQAAREELDAAYGRAQGEDSLAMLLMLLLMMMGDGGFLGGEIGGSESCASPEDLMGLFMMMGGSASGGWDADGPSIVNE